MSENIAFWSSPSFEDQLMHSFSIHIPSPDLLTIALIVFLIRPISLLI